MPNIKNRLFGQEVPVDIIQELARLGKGQNQTVALDEVGDSYEHNLGESMAFARLWCAVDVVTSEGPRGPNGEIVTQRKDGKYIFKDKVSGDYAFYTPEEGEEGATTKNHNIMIYSIGDHNVDSYKDPDDPLNPKETSIAPGEPVEADKEGSVKYIGQLSHNPLMRGSAGITSVTSRSEGPLGSLYRVIVELSVQNKYDFDNIILPYFLRPGSQVCIDFGRDPLGGGFALYDPKDFLSDKDSSMSEFDDKIYGPGGFLEHYRGYVHTQLGVVDNYDMSLNPDGTFNCSLEFVSRNHTLIDKSINDDNDLKYVFNNIFDLVLMNVLRVYDEGAAFTGTSIPDAINIDELFQRRDIYENINFENEVKSFLKTAVISGKTLGRLSPQAMAAGIFHQRLSSENMTDEQKKILADKESTYITLGRLEDLFLNSFVAGVVKPDNISEGFAGTIFSKPSRLDFDTQYDSREGLLRWHDDIFNLQGCKILPNEDLQSFMIPPHWAHTYDNPNPEQFTMGGGVTGMTVTMPNQDNSNINPTEEEEQDSTQLTYDFSPETSYKLSQGPELKTTKFLGRTFVWGEKSDVTIIEEELETITINAANDIKDDGTNSATIAKTRNNPIVLEGDSETVVSDTDETMAAAMDKWMEGNYDQTLPNGFDMRDPRYPGINVMPIRELFISTELIKSAFKQNNTVDSAIQSILNTINKDSNNVWNLKLVPRDDSGTKLMVHDINLMGPQKRLSFDVTSENSIVSNCNIKFSKDTKLSDKIAIQSMSEPRYLDEHLLGHLMHLNALNDPTNKKEFVHVRSLPYQGDIPVKNPRLLNIDKEKINTNVKKGNADGDMFDMMIAQPDDWVKFKTAKEKKIKAEEQRIEDTRRRKGIRKKEIIGNVRSTDQGYDSRILFDIVGYTDEEYTFIDESVEVDSERELYLQRLRKKLHGESMKGSIAPVLPIELDMTVYGNNFLQIGDCFLINYLPQQYIDRVIFQIFGIEHKVTANDWQTSYSSQMKLDPMYKYITSGAEKHIKEPTLPVHTDEDVNLLESTLDELAKQEIDEFEEEYGNELIDFNDPDFDLVEIDPLDLELDDFSWVNDPKHQPPPPPPPKPVQKMGSLLPWEDGRRIGSPLEFKVFTQLKFPLVDKSGLDPLTTFFWNHGVSEVMDIDKFQSYKNLAYMFALRRTLFEDMLVKTKDDGSLALPNISFDPELFDDAKYNRKQYDKPNDPFVGVIQTYSKEEMTNIIKMYPGQEEAILDAAKMFLFQRNFKSSDRNFADYVQDYKDPTFETEVIPIIKRFAFLTRENPDGDMMYYFTLTNASPIVLKEKDEIGRSIAIPKWVLEAAGLNIKTFVMFLNNNYRLALDAFKDAANSKPVNAEPPPPKVVAKVTWEKPSGDDLGDVDFWNASHVNMMAGGMSVRGSDFLVWRKDNNRLNPFFAKTKVTFELDGTSHTETFEAQSATGEKWDMNPAARKVNQVVNRCIFKAREWMGVKKKQHTA